MAGTASASGGYFPTSWGWLGILLGWLAAVGLVVRREIAFTRLEIATLGTLTAFVCWVAFSAAWSQDLPGTVLEIERDLVYPLALLTLLIFARGRSHVGVLGGLATGITAVCVYSLATRLFPGQFGAFDPEAPISGYRLSDPLTYWNALAIFAVMGVLLALGFATESRSTVTRALAGASLVVFLPTLYFTFSRGGWLSLAVGLAALLALNARRLRFATLALVLTPGPAIAVLFASRLDGLTTPAALAQAARDGHRLALVIAVLCVGTAAVAVAAGLVEARLSVPRAAKRVWAALLVILVVASLVSISVRFGSPPTLARKAYDSFTGQGVEVKTGESLERRLFSLSSNGRLDHWRVAWRSYEAHPVLGSGAGSYEQVWFENRPFAGKVRDAHNLYVEVLAELGPVGLILILGALGLPLAAAMRARREAIVPAGAGAYSAYLIHAGVDWDWEMVAVTLTALGIGGSMLIGARLNREALRSGVPGRTALVGATLAASGFAAVGFLGNYPLARSDDRLADERWGAAAVEAHRAIRWQPWAGEPWKQLGLAERGRGDLVAARHSLLNATQHDPGDWVAWIELGTVTSGAEQRRAYAEAARRNPLSSRIAKLCLRHLVPRRLCQPPARP